jgi:energy-coupling factor transporter transmembrane protein EcfT
MSFDVRLQFLMLVACSGVILFTTLQSTLLLVGIALLLLAVQRLWQQLIYWMLLEGFLVLAFWFSDQYLAISAFTFISMILFIMIRISPALIIASSLAVVPPGKLLASLQKLRIPDRVLLTLTVALRFFPVLRAEAKIIQENAVVRGISTKQWRNWLRPAQMFEYTIVPLLMRTIKLADDLSASATTRGIDAPGRKSSIYAIRFSALDSVGFLLLASMLCTPFFNG